MNATMAPAPGRRALPPAVVLAAPPSSLGGAVVNAHRKGGVSIGSNEARPIPDGAVLAALRAQ